jgi:hypothetical protein
VGFRPEHWLPEHLHHYAEHARFLLHRICRGAALGQRDLRGYVPLLAALLRPFFPSSAAYKAVRDALIASGAIETDHKYIVGEKAMGYRLGPALAKVRQHRVVVTDRKLAAKIRASLNDWVEKGRALPVHAHLIDWLTRLRIDYRPALEWLLAQGDLEPSDETAVQFIRDKVWHFSDCPYGRVHSNVTNLKSGLRQFLRIAGKPLVNLDIRNSQPLIFALILQRHYGPLAGMPDDARRYVELCQEGKFYDVLMIEAGIPPDRRSDFKRRFFAHVFFCENWPETESAKAFGAAFPSVYAVVRREKEPDYTELAKNLQRAESGLMIGGVATRLMNEAPQIPVLTIHDSIMTTPEHAETVRSVMLEEFAKAGLRPTIKVDHP